MYIRTPNIPRNYPQLLYDITHQCFAGKKPKNLNFVSVTCSFVGVTCSFVGVTFSFDPITFRFVIPK